MVLLIHLQYKKDQEIHEFGSIFETNILLILKQILSQIFIATSNWLYKFQEKCNKTCPDILLFKTNQTKSPTTAKKTTSKTTHISKDQTFNNIKIV